MTPSQYIKSQGLPSLAYVAKEAGVNARTLHNWYHSKNKLFKVVVSGIVFKKLERQVKDDAIYMSDRIAYCRGDLVGCTKWENR